MRCAETIQFPAEKVMLDIFVVLLVIAVEKEPPKTSPIYPAATGVPVVEPNIALDQVGTELDP